MSFDPGWILLELVIGGVGFVLFTYGRRQERPPQLIGGLVFMVLPFFVSSPIGLLLGAVLATLGTWGAVKLGW